MQPFDILKAVSTAERLDTEGTWGDLEIIFWECYSGVMDANGQTVFLESPMGIFENKTRWILMLGFTPVASGLQA